MFTTVAVCIKPRCIVTKRAFVAGHGLKERFEFSTHGHLQNKKGPSRVLVVSNVDFLLLIGLFS